MMTFAYESKNRIVKNYANVCKQRKNLAKSLSYKSAMRFNYLLRTHQQGFVKVTNHEKARKISFEVLKEKAYFNSIDINNVQDQQIYICTKITHKKTNYEKGFYIVDNIDYPEKLWKIFEIIYVLNDYFFIVENYSIEYYDNHLRSYKVGECMHVFDMINVNDLKSLPFNLQNTLNGVLYFRIKRI